MPRLGVSPHLDRRFAPLSEKLENIYNKIFLSANIRIVQCPFLLCVSFIVGKADLCHFRHVYSDSVSNSQFGQMKYGSPGVHSS